MKVGLDAGGMGMEREFMEKISGMKGWDEEWSESLGMGKAVWSEGKQWGVKASGRNDGLWGEGKRLETQVDTHIHKGTPNDTSTTHN